ncbi:MAG: PASTA domain-containing protein, partial [Acetobacteraceae bacterium]|nr:PASTA domain-containing protein [Acetobacteraceae bacterium]
RLTGAGLAVGTATTASSPTVAASNVIRTDPLAGAPVNPGTAVNLEVSSGPQVAVLDVTGSTRAAAETALRIAGLALGTVATLESQRRLRQRYQSQRLLCLMARSTRATGRRSFRLAEEPRRCCGL